MATETITPEVLAERMKIEIIRDMVTGVIPRTVSTFAELHDYVDANCYGGTEQLLSELATDDSEESHAAALDALCDLMNPAMDIITEWLQTRPGKCS